MKQNRLIHTLVAALLMAGTAHAQDRYASRPPVVLSPDLTAPWVVQLRSPGKALAANQQRRIKTAVAPMRVPVQRQQQKVYRARTPTGVVVQQAAVRAPAKAKSTMRLDPEFLPQVVSYKSSQKAGTIIIDTNQRFLYLVLGNGEARRYGVGVGKPGFEWSGAHKITRKAEWPDWRPPAEMISRVRQKEGRILPAHMPGGPDNPLGARAMYLGSTLYRIHGTNQPWTIGGAVSSGCIRMRNEDVTDLYGRVSVGTKVIVI
jgi:lipoprotein-anchoring transpeptidase ErfK/SrfK